MAEFNKGAIKEAVKLPEQEDVVYVTIPAEDMYDQTHPGVQLIGGSIKVLKDGVWKDSGKAGTNVKFEAGKTYLVPAAVGAEVTDRLKRYDKEQVRLLRPKIDSKSVSQVNKGSIWAKQGGAITSGDSLDTQFANEPSNHRVFTVDWK